MSTREEYLEMLREAREQLPMTIVSGERFTPPKPIIAIEGRQTHVVNFKEIANSLNRDPKLIARYLSKELGSPYFLTEDERKLILSRRIDPRQVENRLDRFIRTYVICPHCGRPDTVIVKVRRAWILRCMACGAETPIPKI
ncbi:MAG: translation initiation factor IF-2 subunit beta [Thermoproteota archaeon]|nr:translation initiation factor IF-2 subunit beta [Candidatus Korarchaeota archaeon]RLG44083.1 MAG: translation initiation factor IF-2 subunit beta [Candidatus Korarchaeota archaeon]